MTVYVYGYPLRTREMCVSSKPEYHASHQTSTTPKAQQRAATPQLSVRQLDSLFLKPCYMHAKLVRTKSSAYVAGPVFVFGFLQVLSMSTRDIDMLIRLWDKFKHGVDEQASC
jgi:hypothetical protein